MNRLLQYQRLDEDTSSPKSPNRRKTSFKEGNTDVAYVIWRADAEFLEVIEIWVEEPYRRIGLGTAIYDTLRFETGLRLKWQRNAWASDAMRALAIKYMDERACVESDDGTTIIIKTCNSEA